MFPSDDPFAYPNQPMTAIENHQSNASPSSGTRDGNLYARSSAQDNLFSISTRPTSANAAPSSSTMTTGAPFDPGLEAQFFGPIQSYFNQNQQVGSGLDLGLGIGMMGDMGVQAQREGGMDGDALGQWGSGRDVDGRQRREWEGWGNGGEFTG